MITISPTSEMPHDLWTLLRDDQGYHNLRTFKYYGVVCTSASEFSTHVVVHCNYIADMLKCTEYRTIQIEPGTWQPGAMRYLIYLIK
jgi:hypothetical protein